MMINFLKKHFYPATYSYIGFIILLNTLFSWLPQVSWLNANFSLADFTVGAIYVMRDLAQREIKHYVIIAMLVGTAISYALADPTIAFASLMAFIAGEFSDWSIYTFTKKPLSQRILWSSLISSPIDSFVNLYFLNQLNWLGLSIMISVKVLGVLFLWLSWKIRQPALLVIS